MTSQQIQIGDLVLRDGRAEEIGDILASRYRPKYWLQMDDVGMPTPYPVLSDATRIGSTRDGWRIHTGTERPMHVGENDKIEWCMADGTKYRDTELTYWRRAVAYRVVSRAEPPISGQGANCGAGSREPTDYVKLLAAEMREWCESAPPGQYAVSVVRAWADRIDPPAPEPLKVGDVVRGSSVPGDYPESYRIVAIEGETAILRAGDFAIVRQLINLERAE